MVSFTVLSVGAHKHVVLMQITITITIPVRQPCACTFEHVPVGENGGPPVVGVGAQRHGYYSDKRAILCVVRVVVHQCCGCGVIDLAHAW